jgi:prepilin-type N-terminal cleavage/methylation domain-containing protein
MHDMQRNLNRGAGFTLIEMAVVVVVIGLLLGGLLIPLTRQIEQRKISDTQQRLARIHDALIAFAIAQGRFPCPADGSPGSNGVEAFVVGGSAADGRCANPTGFGSFNGYLPGATLALNNVDGQGYALDAWGLQQNRIRYAITDQTVNGVQHAFTKSGGMSAAGMQALSNSSNTYLYVCVSATGITNTACSNIAPPTPDPNALARGDAVFVILSLGSNAATSSPGGPDEQENLSIYPRFVSRVASNQSGNEYDDLVLWGSRYTVIGRLVSAGQLP